jgi:hypothetical protein
MSVTDLKRAVTELEPLELEDFLQWAADYHFQKWDAQIETDLKAGRFDDLIESIRIDTKVGLADLI